VALLKVGTRPPKADGLRGAVALYLALLQPPEDQNRRLAPPIWVCNSTYMGDYRHPRRRHFPFIFRSFQRY
jgi:hypothetical protein